MNRASLCVVAVFAAMVACTAAREMPYGKGTNVYTMPPPGPNDGPARQNCSYGGGLGDSWVEITDVQDYIQYASTTPGYTSSDMPDPLPMPYSADTGERWAAPAFEGICFARSPSASQDCTEGVDCLVYLNEFNESWLEIAGLECMASYPTPGLIYGDEAGAPPAGNVTVTLTNQCKMYNYNNSWIATMTDEWGNVFALQTASFPMESDEDWQANLDGVVPPPGWSIEVVQLEEQEDHLPYMAGDGSLCAFPVLRDNMGNAWHQFVYNTPIQEGIFGAVTCTALDIQYTLSSGGI